MVDLWVLHINSLRRTFDQSLMKIFQMVQEIWSGQESVKEEQKDSHTKAISIIPHPLHGRALINRTCSNFRTSIVRNTDPNIYGSYGAPYMSS